MARITSWQSYAAGGVMSATNRSSNSPWVSPFTSSSKVYSTGRKHSKSVFTQKHNRTHANTQRPHVTTCRAALNVQVK